MSAGLVPEVMAFYMTETGDVWQVVGETADRLTLCSPSTGEQFAVPRAPFVSDLRAGYVQRVEPAWQVIEAESTPRSEA